MFNFRERKKVGVIDTFDFGGKKCRCVISVTNYVIFKGLIKFNFSLYFAKLKIKILKGEQRTTQDTKKRMIEIRNFCSHYILSHTTTINYMIFIFFIFFIFSSSFLINLKHYLLIFSLFFSLSLSLFFNFILISLLLFIIIIAFHFFYRFLILFYFFIVYFHTYFYLFIRFIYRYYYIIL